jgi:sucrose-6-phosphate hydrolase SacC (GH32 family)
MIGWMSNWDYAKLLPTEPFRGQMSIPREITLENRGGQITLIQRPVIEIGKYVNDIDPSQLPFKVNEQVSVGWDDSSSAIYLDRSASSHAGGIHRAPVTTSLKETTVKYIIDSTSVELFINDGEATITDLFFD